MHWYQVKVHGLVDRFGVNKTTEGYMHSSCCWTEDKLLAALKPSAEKEGISNLRILEFRPTSRPLSREAELIDLDQMLGI